MKWVFSLFGLDFGRITGDEGLTYDERHMRYTVWDRLVRLVLIIGMAGAPASAGLSGISGLPVDRTPKGHECLFSTVALAAASLTPIRPFELRINGHRFSFVSSLPNADPSRHDAIVKALLSTESSKGWKLLTPSERRFADNLLEIALSPEKHPLTQVQMESAERYLHAIRCREIFNAFFDQLFLISSRNRWRVPILPMSPERIPEMINVLDSFLCDAWSAKRERDRFHISISHLFPSHLPEWDSALLAYAQDHSPLRQDRSYGSKQSSEETLLVSFLIDTSERREEALILIADALLHQNGFRLLTRASVVAAIHAVMWWHRRLPLAHSVFEQLRNEDVMQKIYAWWGSGTQPKWLQQFLNKRPILPAPIATRTEAEVEAIRRTIVRTIRDEYIRHQNPCTPAWAQDHIQELYALAQEAEIFGSWRKALLAAGEPEDLVRLMSGNAELSKEEVTAQAHFPERQMKFKWIVDNRKWTRAALQHFGSLDAAFASAGKPPLALPVLSDTEYSDPLDSNSLGIMAERELGQIEREAPFVETPAQRTSQHAHALRARQLAMAYLGKLEAQAAKTPDSTELSMQIAKATAWVKKADRMASPLTYMKPTAPAPSIRHDEPSREEPYQSFRVSVYERLPWHEEFTWRNGIKIYKKRAALPGVDMNVASSDDGSWSISIAPGWRWNPARNGGQTDALFIGWDAGAHILSGNFYKGLPEQHVELDKTPIVVLVFSPRLPLTIQIENGNKLRSMGDAASGRTGWYIGHEVVWRVQFKDEISSVGSFSIPPAHLFTPLASLVTLLHRKLPGDASVLRLVASIFEFYDPIRGELYLFDLVQTLHTSQAIREFQAIHILNEWLGSHYGYQLRVSKNGLTRYDLVPLWPLGDLEERFKRLSLSRRPMQKRLGASV